MPTFTRVDFVALVHEAEGTDYDEKEEHETYRFSRRTFKEDDSAGVYEDAEE